VRTLKIALGLSLLFLLTVSVAAQKATSDWDHGINFSEYKTFMWVQQAHMENPAMDKRVTDDINKQLARKRWKLVNDNADVGVVAHGSTDKEMTLERFYVRFPEGWQWQSWEGATVTKVTTYPVGTLVVDLFDTKTKRVVWRGIAIDTFSEKAKKNEHRLEEAIEDMFSHFPPKSK
jgi:Domain of unknown function (DUF4136)